MFELLITGSIGIFCICIGLMIYDPKVIFSEAPGPVGILDTLQRKAMSCIPVWRGNGRRVEMAVSVKSDGRGKIHCKRSAGVVG